MLQITVLIGQIGSVGWYLVQQGASDVSVPVTWELEIPEGAIAEAVLGVVAAFVCNPLDVAGGSRCSLVV